MDSDGDLDLVVGFTPTSPSILVCPVHTMIIDSYEMRLRSNPGYEVVVPGPQQRELFWASRRQYLY